MRTLLNGLIAEPARTGVFLDGFTADDAPVIDYSLGSQRVVGAVGFAGHGFKFSPAVGQIIADFVAAQAGLATSGLEDAAHAFQRSRTLK